MRRLAHAALGVAGLAALVSLALAVLLPGFVASDRVRARVEAAAHLETGRELRFERLELDLPSRALRMLSPRLAGADPDSPALAEAPEALLHLAWDGWPARPIWVDRLEVAGATLRLAQLARAPAGGVELRELAAVLSRSAPAAPVAVDAAFAWPGGGRGSARGRLASGGEGELEVTLVAVDAARLALPLEAGARLAGTLDGTLALGFAAASPRRLSARLALRDGDVRVEEIVARGALRLALELAADPISGGFELDAGGATLEFGRSYRKQPGIPARVRGRIIAGKRGGLAVDDVKLHIGDPGA